MAVADTEVLAPTRTGRTTGGWQAVAAHWLIKYRRVWLGTAITSFLSPLLYLAGMGFGLGLLVDRGAGGIGGVPYVVFIAPGVLAATTLQVAAGETTFSVVGSIKWTPIYQGMLATPLKVRDVVVGHLAYVLVRVTLAAVVFFAVAALFGTVRSPWGVVAVGVATLGGMAFASCCYAYSASLTNDQGLVLMFRFVVMPMSLFSGTFFPIEQLPGWLQPVAWATPLWHTVDACRALVLGTATVGGVLGHVAYLALWLVGGYLMAVRVLRRRMVV
ncbi:ABC transporter permease [Cellulomonas sp. KRMCY2]|uniref:ABC transporter permease n=1 Tax=Cellulomonas sp. KRMCY2 TaxID=1304865 RepID=UPI00045E8B2B|nr:ABC transporter permease [Cellulomonas sp. KRMCY2]